MQSTISYMLPWGLVYGSLRRVVLEGQVSFSDGGSEGWLDPAVYHISVNDKLGTPQDI